MWTSELSLFQRFGKQGNTLQNWSFIQKLLLECGWMCMPIKDQQLLGPCSVLKICSTGLLHLRWDAVKAKQNSGMLIGGNKMYNFWSGKTHSIIFGLLLCCGFIARNSHLLLNVPCSLEYSFSAAIYCKTFWGIQLLSSFFLFSAMTGCQSTTNEDSSQKPYIPWVQSVGLYSNELDKHLETRQTTK